jgi:uncharacterized protein (DUF2252 family)
MTSERSTPSPTDAAATSAAVHSVGDAVAAGLAATAQRSTLDVGSRGERADIEQRRARGRAARAATSRRQLAEWTPGPDRADPVELLIGQESTRVQELVPVRHARMAVSAFTFYRGSALVMASDLATQPRTPLTAQLCGDAHLSNFGLFGSPDRSVVFDVNDFDETHPGPFEWDVKRLATSFVLAARDNGLPDKAGLAAAGAAAGSYRQSMHNFAALPELDIWYDRVDQHRLAANVKAIRDTRLRKEAAKNLAKSRKAAQKAVEKARTRDAWSVIAKITEVVDGRRQFRNSPPLLDRIGGDAEVVQMVSDLFEEYRTTLPEAPRELLRRYELVDIGHKVVGVGSVGLLAFALLMRGRDDNDLIALQVKQAQTSVLEDYTEPSPYSHHGQRVVAGQHKMQAASDSFLGWVESRTGRHYYVRQLRDMKWSPDPSTLDAGGLRRYAILCGHTLAHSHARTGDAIAISAYLGEGSGFARAIATFAGAYADQVERDFAAFCAAINDERVTAVEEAGGGEGARAAQRAASSGKKR